MYEFPVGYFLAALSTVEGTITRNFTPRRDIEVNRAFHVMVEEKDETPRVHKRYQKDKQEFVVQELRRELVDIFVDFMRACMALKMDLEKDHLNKQTKRRHF